MKSKARKDFHSFFEGFNNSCSDIIAFQADPEFFLSLFSTTIDNVNVSKNMAMLKKDSNKFKMRRRTKNSK